MLNYLLTIRPCFNNVKQATFQKHLAIILDTPLSFEKHLETVLCKINKTIGLIGKFRNLLPRTALITLYKAFVRLHLDNGDIIYDQAHNASFHQKLESLQYNARLPIAGAIRGSSREKLYQELGFESLKQCHWYRKLCSFYNIFKNGSLHYLFNINPTRNSSYIRNHAKIPLFKTNHNFFKNSFFLSSIIEWNNLDPNLRNSDTNGTFKNTVLKFIRPSPNSLFECHNPPGVKFLTRLRLGLSYLHEHKFRHSFPDLLNPLCKCGFEFESTPHFLLHRPIYNNDRSCLLSTIKNIDWKLLKNTDSSLTQTLLYGNPSRWLEQYGLCCNTNTRPSFLNTQLTFSNHLKASKAWPSVWKAQLSFWKTWPSVWKALPYVLRQVLNRMFC